MHFNIKDTSRNTFQLFGAQAAKGYDWWWHSFTGYDATTGEARAFFIEFFLCNPASGGPQPVFGQAGGGRKPSYLMVKAGSWGKDARQLHRFFGWGEVQIDKGNPFGISAADCSLSETMTKGSINVSEQQNAAHPEWMSDAGEMQWNLRIDKKIAFNVGYGASRLFRQMQLFEMFWHAEGMKTEFSGEVTWCGRKYIVRPHDCYGYADKNWGKDFTSPWIWLSSNNITDMKSGRKLHHSVFDIGGGKPKIGPVALSDRLLSAFWIEGKEYEFNFSKFWTFTSTSFRCAETDSQITWHIEQRNLSHRMTADFTCEKDQMLLIRYESPDGARRHNRLWNGGNGKGRIRIYRGNILEQDLYAENTGCEYGVYGQ